VLRRGVHPRSVSLRAHVFRRYSSAPAPPPIRL
jgi:hypothetical protein